MIPLHCHGESPRVVKRDSSTWGKKHENVFKVRDAEERGSSKESCPQIPGMLEGRRKGTERMSGGCVAASRGVHRSRLGFEERGHPCTP